MKPRSLTMLDDAAITAVEHGTLLRTLADTIVAMIVAHVPDRWSAIDMCNGLDALLSELQGANDATLDTLAEVFVGVHRERMRGL